MRRAALLAPAAALLFACASPQTTGAPPLDLVNAELRRLAGTWRLVEGYFEGKKLTDAEVQRTSITWKGNRIESASPHISPTTIVATLHVDPTKSPRQMDIVFDTDPGARGLAIYEWLGPDRYRICIDRQGRARPAEFTPDAKVCQTLHVWQRDSR